MDKITVYLECKDSLSMVSTYQVLETTPVEKKEGYFFTEEELRKLVINAHRVGKLAFESEQGWISESHPNEDGYFDNLLTPTTQP